VEMVLAQILLVHLVVHVIVDSMELVLFVLTLMNVCWVHIIAAVCAQILLVLSSALHLLVPCQPLNQFLLTKSIHHIYMLLGWTQHNSALVSILN